MGKSIALVVAALGCVVLVGWLSIERVDICFKKADVVALYPFRGDVHIDPEFELLGNDERDDVVISMSTEYATRVYLSDEGTHVRYRAVRVFWISGNESLTFYTPTED